MKHSESIAYTLVIICCVAAGGLTLVGSGDFHLSWYSIDGGGGTSTGGTYQVRGTAGQADAGDMAGGTFVLRGGFWPAASQPAGAADAPGAALPPHDARKHRYLSIDSATNGATEVGLKVELTSLGRCTGDLERSCVEDNDCDSGETGPCVEHPDVRSTWWVQAPQEEPLGCLPGPCGPTDQFARVDAAFHSQVWNLTTLHIGDCEIVPIATYEIRACFPPEGLLCSDPLTIGTIEQPFISPGFRGNYGDVAGNVVGTEFAPPDGVANIVDVSAYQLTTQNYGTANTPQTHPTWVDLNGLGAGQPPQSSQKHFASMI